MKDINTEKTNINLYVNNDDLVLLKSYAKAHNLPLSKYLISSGLNNNPGNNYEVIAYKITDIMNLIRDIKNELHGMNIDEMILKELDKREDEIWSLLK